MLHYEAQLQLTAYKPELAWFQRSQHIALPTFITKLLQCSAARAWNSLPLTVTSQTSLLTFRRQLKTALFDRSYR